MNQAHADALWEQVLDDYRHDHWANVECVALAFASVLRPDPSAPSLTIFGIPVRIDPALAPGELRLEGADGALVRLVNIGESL